MSMTTILTPNFMVCPDTGRWVPMIERNASHSLRYSLQTNGGWKVSDVPGESHGIAFLRPPLSRLKAAMSISQHGNPVEVIDFILDTPPRELPNYLRPQWSYPLEGVKAYFDYRDVVGICKGLFDCEIVWNNKAKTGTSFITIPDHRLDELALWMHQDDMLYLEVV